MFKSKWIRIPIKIILILLVITIYFYFQHPVVYRCQDLSAVFPIGDDAQLLIHEIRVNDLDEDQEMRWLDNEEMPWKYQLLQKMNEMGVPSIWNMPVLKIISYYSWPPLAKDSWTLQIYGTFIYPEDAGPDESCIDYFDIDTYPGGTSSGGSLHEFFRNADMIRAEGEIDPQQMDEPMIITVIDKENAKSTKLILTPQWQKERLFKQGDNYKSPADPVRRFINSIYAGKPRQALENVLPGRQSGFALPEPSQDLQGKNIQMEGRLTWVDVFKGYVNVYRVDAEVGAASENNFIPQEKMTFYTVRDQDGNYKIICWKAED